MDTQELKARVLDNAGDRPINPLGIKKVTCKICNRRRDLYFVGSDIYCIDHSLAHLEQLIANKN